MSELQEGIDRALAAFQRGLRGPVVSPGPWEEIVGQLETAREVAAGTSSRHSSA